MAADPDPYLESDIPVRKRSCETSDSRYNRQDDIPGRGDVLAIDRGSRAIRARADPDRPRRML
jgi:hypothetical protein